LNQETRVAAVQETEAIKGWGHFELRPGNTIYHDHVEEGLRVPDGGDVGTAVGNERYLQLPPFDALEERPAVGIEERAVRWERS
jgi:hypothetical protein